MDVGRSLQDLVARPDVRTADRAHMHTMLRKLKGGGDLSYQDRMNLYAYFNRYGLPAVNDRHF